MKTRIDDKGNEYILFKAINFVNTDSQVAVKKCLTLVKKKSIEFTGVDITDLLYQSEIFKLYNDVIFVNEETKDTYMFLGVDTENWKGFKLRITKILNKDQLKEISK